MKPLFVITNEMLKLEIVLDELEMIGSSSAPLANKAVADWLATLQSEQSTKLAGYCDYVRMLETEAEVCRQQAEEFTKKARTRENRVQYLKDRVRQHLTTTGQSRVFTDNGYTLTVAANGGKLPLVIKDGVGPDDVPNECIKVVESLDIDAIRKKLEAGEVLDFAELGERGTHLRIK